MPTHKKLLYLLTRYEKRRAILLLCMILIVAFLEMIGVASIMPFMAVLTSPELIQTNPIINNLTFQKNLALKLIINFYLHLESLYSYYLCFQFHLRL